MQINTQMSKSSSTGSGENSAIRFGVDLNRDAVFVSSQVRNSVAFSKAMLALGGVVRFSSEFQQRDHTRYQAWVKEQYLKEAESKLLAQASLRHSIEKEIDNLESERTRLNSILLSMRKKFANFSIQQRKFWDWLYENDRDLWFILDPIVSVQEKSTYFEAFSQDESMYVLVELPHSQLSDSSEIKLGTTNIDFGLHLEREFKRIRSYRPLTLTIGQLAVSIATDVSQAVEKKIDLPESWIEGLVQVSAAQILPATKINLSPLFVGKIISKLESIREKTGPRSLRFQLIPHQPIKIVIEPWGIELVDFNNNYEGSSNLEIRIWGRRRLSLLKQLLPTADSVTVSLLGDGMPSFWIVKNAEIKTTFGFSGWNALDWSKKMQFSAFLPVEEFEAADVAKALDLIKTSHTVDIDEIVKVLNLKPTKAMTLVQTLAFHGKVMYLPEENRYVYRELVPGWQPMRKVGGEERKGADIAKDKNYFNSIDRQFAENKLIVKGTTKDSFTVIIHRDQDLRIIYAQCNCSFFNYNKLRLGPCRHIVALGLS
jgi:hypothetical protein